MCGIAGFLDSKKRGLPLTDIIGEMGDAITHRGRDHDGRYISSDGSIALTHRRLSIIDLSADGNQPIYNKEKTHCIIVNGEVYNYREINKELTELGHKFGSSSDSEVILHAWLEWGPKCLDRFNGMFAFALLEIATGKIWLCRDRLGIKPLYYAEHDGFLAFASEFKAFTPLRKRGLIPMQLDLDSLASQLFANFSLSLKDTLVNEIKRLEPGQYLEYDGSARIHTWWELKEDPSLTALDFDQALEGLKELLNDSVRLRLHADVPVGILLSGGLDSSLIAAMAAKIKQEPVHTYTSGNSQGNDEREHARQVAAHIGSHHSEIILDPQDINNNLSDFASYFDDLSSFDAGIIPIYLITRKVTETGIKVLLFGDGADEIFGGYSWFGLSKLPFKFLPPIMRNFLYYYANTRYITYSGLIKPFMQIHRQISTGRKRDIFTRISHYETTRQLPPHYLMKVDRGTMASTLEGRVPYMDHRVVEYAYSLKSSYKMKGRFFSFRGANEKYIQREAGRGLLPESILNRKKYGGFSIPFNEVIMSDRDYIRRVLLQKDSFARRMFSERHIRSLFNFKVRPYHPLHIQRSYLIYRLYLTQTWLDCFEFRF